MEKYSFKLVTPSQLFSIVGLIIEHTIFIFERSNNNKQCFFV